VGRILGDVAAILIAATIMAAVAAGAVVAGVFWLRRTWRRKRVLLALRAQGVAVGAAAAGIRWVRTRPVPDRRWWVLQRARTGLVRASAGAEHAVREAKAARAPLGDLEGLTRRLRHAALDVDRSLKIAQQAGAAEPVDELLVHASRLATAGRQIQHAAAESLVGLHRHTTDELVDHVRVEERAISSRLVWSTVQP
jgi:hypothetical protein